jgi:hypothetical protein
VVTRGTSLVEVLLALALLALALLGLAAAALERARAFRVASVESAVGLAARARVEEEWARLLWGAPARTDEAPGTAASEGTDGGTSDSGAGPAAGTVYVRATWVRERGTATLIVRATYDGTTFRRGDTLALAWPEARP